MKSLSRFSIVRPLIVLALTGMPVTSAAPFDSRSARGQAAEPRVIEVVARRFAFEPDVIEVTVGERVRLMVRSGDGLHGFEIKKLKINKDIPRGSEPVAIDFTANEAGRFPIMCSEYCGDDHDSMRGTLVVTAQ